MIQVLESTCDPDTIEIVTCALMRSFTRGQVRIVQELGNQDSSTIAVTVAPTDDMADDLAGILDRGGKLVLLGPLPPRIAAIAAIEPMPVAAELAILATCDPAPLHQDSESRAALLYANSGLGAASPLHRRCLVRFDYADEWNNLGYGRIGVGSDRWSIAQLARTCATVVADAVVDDTRLGAAVALHDAPSGSVLWFARPVGPVDGHDWAVMEAFISRHRAGELPCRPYLRGIPNGFAAGVTTRLDCDEDIASARPLFELYQARGFPLSLAIKTDQVQRPEHLALLRDVRKAGGSILSHSVTHAPRWGGSPQSAQREARDSKAWLQHALPGLTVRHAVSPFHQNPAYVPQALADAGYEGFIAGSIAWDPEYLLARAGVPPFAPPQIVSHSQSCMLHGDCMPTDGDPLRVFKQAFLLARDSGEFFGYLDHPFSERYSYGWQDEATRLETHARCLDFIAQAAAGELLFVNEETCLDFVAQKAAAEILYDVPTGAYTIRQSHAAPFSLSVSYQGQVSDADHFFQASQS
jgi:hypothetical protein